MRPIIAEDVASAATHERRTMTNYHRPTVTTLGNVAAVTEQTGSAPQMNKVGRASDQFTAISNGIVVGDFVPAP